MIIFFFHKKCELEWRVPFCSTAGHDRQWLPIQVLPMVSAASISRTTARAPSSTALLSPIRSVFISWNKGGGGGGEGSFHHPILERPNGKAYLASLRGNTTGRGKTVAQNSPHLLAGLPWNRTHSSLTFSRGIFGGHFIFWWHHLTATATQR